MGEMSHIAIFFHQDAFSNAFDGVLLLRCLVQMPQGLCDVLPLQPLLAVNSGTASNLPGGSTKTTGVWY